jgi:hypothetical protein
MIRIRRANGTEIELPADAQFVELVDSDGKIGRVFFMDGVFVGTFSGGSEEARRYKRLYNKVEFCNVVEATT